MPSNSCAGASIAGAGEACRRARRPHRSDNISPSCSCCYGAQQIPDAPAVDRHDAGIAETDRALFRRRSRYSTMASRRPSPSTEATVFGPVVRPHAEDDDGGLVGCTAAFQQALQRGCRNERRVA